MAHIYHFYFSYKIYAAEASISCSVRHYDKWMDSNFDKLQKVPCRNFNILGVQISFEGFFGGPSFVNPSKLICTPNINIL